MPSIDFPGEYFCRGCEKYFDLTILPKPLDVVKVLVDQEKCICGTLDFACKTCLKCGHSTVCCKEQCCKTPRTEEPRPGNAKRDYYTKSEIDVKLDFAKGGVKATMWEEEREWRKEVIDLLQACCWNNPNLHKDITELRRRFA